LSLHKEPRQVQAIYNATTFGRDHEALPSAVPNEVSKEKSRLKRISKKILGQPIMALRGQNRAGREI